MNEVIKAIDDQMLEWVAELDELNERKREIDKAIDKLKWNIHTLRESVEILREEEN